MGKSLYSAGNSTNYRNQHHQNEKTSDNPYLVLIKEFQDYGVKFIACGQAMLYFGVEKEDMVPGIKKSLTAQTVISSYQLNHYVYYDMSIRD